MKHSITTYSPGFVPTYVANGLVGLRIGANPLQDGTALVDGYFGLHEVERIESLEPAPYPLTGDVAIDGLWLEQRPDLVAFRDQTYDFECGELRTRLAFTANGITAKLDILTFCSRSQPTLALQELRITVTAPCSLNVRAAVDPVGLPGRCVHRQVPNQGWCIADGSLLLEAQGGVSQCGVAYITEFSGGDSRQAKRDFLGYRSAVTTDYSLAADAGQEYILRQYASLVAGPAHTQPDQHAVRMVRTGLHSGFELLRTENRAAWAELWRGRILLTGAPKRWQDIADAAFFYLHSSAHASAWHSTPCFGLGHRNYFGMILWDTASFSLPTVLLSAPRIARAMLDHHSRTLDAARRNAALNGQNGLLFGSGGRLGEEMVPSWAATVFIEQHFSMAVAKAFLQYIHATGDRLFAQRQGWPVVEGVAEWIVSRVKKTARGYEIRNVTGPDEGIENVHNNAYTNMLATQLLRAAAALAKQLGYPPSPRWAEVASGLVLPVDSVTKALKKHDSHVDGAGMFNPETLLAFFPHGYRPRKQVLEATLEHDLAHVRSYIGQPMFSPFCAVLALRAGKRQLAGELLEGGVAGYVVDPFLTFAEYGPGKGADRARAPAPYMATMGAFLQSCVYGFGGLEIGPGFPASWCKYPVALPEDWEGVAIERIFVRGRPARFTARRDATCAVLEFD